MIRYNNVSRHPLRPHDLKAQSLGVVTPSTPRIDAHDAFSRPYINSYFFFLVVCRLNQHPRFLETLKFYTLRGVTFFRVPGIGPNRNWFPSFTRATMAVALDIN